MGSSSWWSRRGSWLRRGRPRLKLCKQKTIPSTLKPWEYMTLRITKLIRSWQNKLIQKYHQSISMTRRLYNIITVYITLRGYMGCWQTQRMNPWTLARVVPWVQGRAKAEMIANLKLRIALMKIHLKSPRYSVIHIFSFLNMIWKTS